MSQRVPGRCVTSGDVGGCYVLWHGGAQAVGLRGAPVHRTGGCAVGQVAYRHRSTAHTITTPSTLLQVIVETQGAALWRILHYPDGWFVGQIPPHARQRIAIVTGHQRNLTALRHVSSSLIHSYKQNGFNTLKTKTNLNYI